MKSFIKKYDPYISVQNANFLKNKLKKKIQDVFQINNISISEEITNNLFCLIQLSHINNFKGQKINLEKKFSEALLNIGVSNNKNSDYNKEFYAHNSNNFNLDDYILNDQNKELNINIDEINEVIKNVEQEIKENNLPTEPKKSKQYNIKQFSFEDFVILSKKDNHYNEE